MNKLFEPAKIHTMELKNRFVRSATWTGTADETGTVTEKTIRLAEFLAKGSVGLLISGHCFVSEKGKASVRQKAIYDDRFVDGLARLAEKVHAGGAKTALQLAHAGIFAASLYTFKAFFACTSVISLVSTDAIIIYTASTLFIVSSGWNDPSGYVFNKSKL
mgnify:CR=1 FL=1